MGMGMRTGMGMGWKWGWRWEWGWGGTGEQELSTPPLRLRTEVTLNAEAGTVGTEFFHPYSQLSGGD